MDGKDLQTCVPISTSAWLLSSLNSARMSYLISLITHIEQKVNKLQYSFVKMQPYYYKNVIDKFSRSYMNLHKEFKITITPKIHIIMDHLADFFRMNGGQSLKITTDQLIEASHQHVKNVFRNSLYNETY